MWIAVVNIDDTEDFIERHGRVMAVSQSFESLKR